MEGKEASLGQSLYLNICLGFPLHCTQPPALASAHCAMPWILRSTKDHWAYRKGDANFKAGAQSNRRSKTQGSGCKGPHCLEPPPPPPPPSHLSVCVGGGGGGGSQLVPPFVEKSSVKLTPVEYVFALLLPLPLHSPLFINVQKGRSTIPFHHSIPVEHSTDSIPPFPLQSFKNHFCIHVNGDVNFDKLVHENMFTSFIMHG